MQLQQILDSTTLDKFPKKNHGWNFFWKQHSIVNLILGCIFIVVILQVIYHDCKHDVLLLWSCHKVQVYLNLWEFQVMEFCLYLNSIHFGWEIYLDQLAKKSEDEI